MISYDYGNGAMPAFTFQAMRNETVREVLGLGHREASIELRDGADLVAAARHYGDAGTDGSNGRTGAGWVGLGLAPLT